MASVDTSMNMDDVFTFKMEENDENIAPGNSTNVPTQEMAKSPLASFPANNNSNNDEEDIDVNALLADMQSDINDAGTDTSMTVSAPMAEEVAESDSTEAPTDDASDADVLSQFKTMMMSADGNTSVSSEVVECEVVAPVVANTEEEEASTGPAAASRTDDGAAETAVMATVEMSIADRCAALLSSVSINPIPTDDSSCNTSSDIIMMDSSTIHEYTDMSDQVAKFALEAMNEDEPKYTEKEMDVLHKKAKIEAAQAFAEQEQALLAQMKMMEAKMQEHQKEKAAMKAEMEEVNQLVAGFESMAESVAKKKDDEIYQLFESKKQVEQELKDTTARCEALEAEVKEAGERKAMGELQHSEEINTINDAHKEELAKVQAQLQEAQSANAEIQAELEKTRSALTNAEKQRAQFEAANKKLKAELDEATANADKYKHLGAKTRDQAQAQLDKAKQLVIATKSECANLKHTVASLEDTCKANVEQLEAATKARETAELENKDLKERVEKQQEDMKQLTLEAYRCTKAEQELEKQKKSNKELYEMCNELMKQVEANKKPSQ